MTRGRTRWKRLESFKRIKLYKFWTKCTVLLVQRSESQLSGLWMRGWGERALCIVRIQLTTPYSSNIKEQNLTSRELEPTRKLKNLEQRILSPQLRSFMASLIFAYLYLYVLFYSYSWLLFSAFYWFILLMNQYTWYDLIQTEVDDSLLCLFCKLHKRYSEQLNSSFFEPNTIMFIIILIIITTNIYWVLTICCVLLHVFYMYYLI